MKVRLLNGEEYTITNIENKGETIEISIKNIVAEDAEALFCKRELLDRIEVYNTTKLTTTLLGYTVLSEVKLKSGTVFVVLTKEADTTEQRITAAYAAAVKADAATKGIAQEIEQLTANMDYLAMEMGVEV